MNKTNLIGIGVLVVLATGCRLNITQNDGGTISSSSGDYNCQEDRCSYDIDSINETFTATPDPGYEFDGWLGWSNCKDLEPCNININLTPEQAEQYDDSPVNLSARFVATFPDQLPTPSSFTIENDGNIYIHFEHWPTIQRYNLQVEIDNPNGPTGWQQFTLAFAEADEDCDGGMCRAFMAPNNTTPTNRSYRVRITSSFPGGIPASDYRYFDR